MIINEIAHMYNNLLINLYSSGIHFYQIILGLFIFNFILYEIRFIVRHFE